MLLRRWLDAAGITDPVLRECYTACSRILDAEGKVYISIMIHSVPAARRPCLVAALATLVVGDQLADTGPVDLRQQRLDEWSEALKVAVDRGKSVEPVLHAAAHALRTGWDTPPWSYIDGFFRATRRDTEFTEFATFQEFSDWALDVNGGPAIMLVSAGSLPLGKGYEQLMGEWGVFSQLADSLSDLSEDLPEGRLYLPLEDLERFGVNRADLEAGQWSADIANLIAFETRRITDRLPHLTARTARHPGGNIYARAMSILYREWCEAILEAGPALLHREVLPPSGRQLTIFLDPWRTALTRPADPSLTPPRRKPRKTPC